MRGSEVSKVLTMLLGAYPNANVTEETVVVYEKMLSDLKSGTVVQVVLEHIATSKWFPTISEIRDKVFEVELELPHAEEVMWQLQSRNFKFGHPIVRKALEACGGVWSFQNSTMPAKWRAEFRTAYENLCKEARLAKAREGFAKLRGDTRKLLDG